MCRRCAKQFTHCISLSCRVSTAHPHFINEALKLGDVKLSCPRSHCMISIWASVSDRLEFESRPLHYWTLGR